MSILPKILPRNDYQKALSEEKRLIQFESRLTQNIFGPVPANHNREFFCLDEHTWIWHEDWLDEKGNRQVQSTRYVIRADGAIKSQNGQSYQRVGQVESTHLYKAIKKYASIVQSRYSQLLAA